jgi:hypothetical protein
MKMRPLFEPTSLGPEALERVTQAFDEAWKQIEQRVGGDAEQIHAARTILAKAILKVASGEVDNVDVIKTGALKMVLHHFRWT